MKNQTDQHCCQHMSSAILDKDSPIVYVPKFREYGITILDGGTSYQLLSHCPWCGCPLPKSLRDNWFEELDKLELEPDDSAVPESMKSDKWWKDRLGKKAAS